MRETRDLLRRRLYFVRQRGQLLAHIQNTQHQYNLPEPTRKAHLRGQPRRESPSRFTDPSVRKSVEVDLDAHRPLRPAHPRARAVPGAHRQEMTRQTFDRLRSFPASARSWP